MFLFQSDKNSGWHLLLPVPTADILTKVSDKLTKSLNLHTHKSHLNKLKFCRNVHNVSLYSVFVAVVHVLSSL